MTITEQLGTITAQLDLAPQARTWDELYGVIELAFIANPTPAQWAVIDAREGRVWKPDKVKAADLVTHKDGSVTGGKGKTAVGSLTHENGGKWVAHHGDGSVTKHANKPAALKAMAAHHNVAAGQPAPAAPKPAAALPPPAAPRPAADLPAPSAHPAAPGAAKLPAKISSAGLVVHQDGTVTSKFLGKAQPAP